MKRLITIQPGTKLRYWSTCDQLATPSEAAMISLASGLGAVIVENGTFALEWCRHLGPRQSYAMAGVNVTPAPSGWRLLCPAEIPRLETSSALLSTYDSLANSLHPDFLRGLASGIARRFSLDAPAATITLVAAQAAQVASSEAAFERLGWTLGEIILRGHDPADEEIAQIATNALEACAER